MVESNLDTRLIEEMCVLNDLLDHPNR